MTRCECVSEPLLACEVSSNVVLHGEHVLLHHHRLPDPASRGTDERGREGGASRVP